MTTIDKVEHSPLIYKCLEECGKNGTVMFSDFVVVASDEIIKTRSTDSIRLLKSSWKNWVSIVAKQMNITVDYSYDNWHIIEKRLWLEKLPAITSTTSSDENISSLSSSNNTNSSSRSNRSTLGIPLSDDDKTKILGLYDRLENSKMWRLSSDRYVEKVMRDFCAKTKYLHPANSLILDLEDDHWSEWFTKQELEEVNTLAEHQKKHLPPEMKTYLDALPESDNIDILFNHLNEQQINPSEHRGLYFLKTTLLYSLDLFRISYLPLTDQGERDIMRRIWVIIDWAFDGSNLKARNEKASFASKSDKNKKRKIAAATSMARQRSSDISDLLIYYDRYEFCSVEAGKAMSNDTKKKNDSTKLAVNCKQMLLNLSHYAPWLQQEMITIGISISGMKLTVYELCNPKGMVCVNKKVDELYFPVHIIEWRNKMRNLCEKLWIIRMEIEERFRAVCASGGEPTPCTLTPCFQKS